MGKLALISEETVRKIVTRQLAFDAVRAAFEAEIIPRLLEFSPEILFISAGFDAHLSDPLADQKLSPADFSWMTERLMAVAEICCEHRLVSTLEGGYNPAALAQSGAAYVRALMRR